MRAASISVLPGQSYGNVRHHRHYQQSACATSFLGKSLNLSHDVFVKTQNLQSDYFKAKPVSFKGVYNRQEAENLVDKIHANQLRADGKGFQSEYFKLNEEFGLKAPNPREQVPWADTRGMNNAKEYYILQRVQAIDPDIAVRPVDLINKYDKNYLVMEHLEGKHPFSTKLTSQYLADIMNKAYLMDINGITHNDLQSGNIIISNDNKVKFIDFGSFNLLTNSGRYVSSDEYGAVFIKEGQNINSPLKDKFRAVFYNDSPAYDIKNYSDNPYLNIKSNASNFEFRTIYDYIKQNKAEDPKQLFTDYLKAKSQNYHTKMAEFLENMDIAPGDTAQAEMRNKALETEKMFKEVFAAPSENVAKTELSKIQLKWLINDYQGAHVKAFDYFKRLFKQTQEFAQNSTGIEKTYFDTVLIHLDRFKEMLNNDRYKGAVLLNSDDVVKKVFDKAAENIAKVFDITPENISKPLSRAALFNKKNVFITLGVAAITAGGVYLNNTMKSAKHANMS